MGITHGKTQVYEIYLPTWRKEIIWEGNARFSALKRRYKTPFVTRFGKNENGCVGSVRTRCGCLYEGNV
jgi:hypothetical protein